MALSKQLAAVLNKKGYQVTLTRTDDRYLFLDERTGMVNKLHPDLLLSVHINASKNKQMSGIETFCLAPHLFKEKHSPVRAHQKIAALYYTKRTDLYAKSNQAADCIHDNLVASARLGYPQVKDRHVQHKIPQVLYGVHVPAVLVEVGFLSHAQEGKLLQDAAYQNYVVDGMAKGIDRFFATHHS